MKKNYEYHEGIFDKYKEIDNLDEWEDFPEIMCGLGYEMDCENSFVEYCNQNDFHLKAPHSIREERKYNLYALEYADRKIVGNYLFSHWRYWTHWDMGNGYDGFVVDYLRRIIAILETKYKEENKG